jgi:hypothetical protein
VGILVPGRISADRLTAVVPVLLAVSLFAFHILQFGNYIADDAAITFAYAKNLARGHGLVLNPGTDPVEGYSNFAWLLVVLPFCARGTDPTRPVKVISFVLGALTLVLVALSAARLAAGSRSDRHRWLSGGAALGLAAFTPYAVWASAGLENALYCALFVAALFLYLRHSMVGCALALVGLAMTRVEGAGIAALFAAHRAGWLAVDRTRPSRADAAAVVAFVALGGAYYGWHWWYFRAFLPNSYLAKSVVVNGGINSVLSSIGGGWDYAYAQLIAPYRLLFVAPLAVVGLLRLQPRLRTLMTLLIAGVSGLILLTGGDFYPEFRLGTLFLPLWFLLLTEGSRAVVSRVRANSAAAIVALIPLIVICQPGVMVASTWGLGPISMGGLKPLLADRFSDLSRSMKKSPITVLESDIGNVAYFTDFTVIDLGGLANLHIARYGLNSPFFLRYVFEEARPDVIHLRDTWAARANIPIALLERDYRRLEGQPAGPFADGWYVLRDAERAASPPSAASPRAASAPEVSSRFAPHDGGSREVAEQIRRQCLQTPERCHADVAVSKHAQSVAEAYRRDGRFEEAFNWYAAAFDADRRNIVALRGREHIRIEAGRSCRPGRPGDVEVSTSGSDVTVRWGPSPGHVTSYVVEAGSRSGLSDLAEIRAATVTMMVPGVRAGTYHVRVKAENDCGWSEPSNEIVVVVR